MKTYRKLEVQRKYSIGFVLTPLPNSYSNQQRKKAQIRSIFISFLKYDFHNLPRCGNKNIVFQNLRATCTLQNSQIEDKLVISLMWSSGSVSGSWHSFTAPTVSSFPHHTTHAAHGISILGHLTLFLKQLSSLTFQNRIKETSNSTNLRYLNRKLYFQKSSHYSFLSLFFHHSCLINPISDKHASFNLTTDSRAHRKSHN